MNNRVINTMVELDTLNEESIVMSTEAYVEDGPGYRIPALIAQRADEENWYVIGSEMPVTAMEFIFPLTVLWEPAA